MRTQCEPTMEGAPPRAEIEKRGFASLTLLFVCKGDHESCHSSKENGKAGGIFFGVYFSSFLPHP